MNAAAFSAKKSDAHRNNLIKIGTYSNQFIANEGLMQGVPMNEYYKLVSI